MISGNGGVFIASVLAAGLLLAAAAARAPASPHPPAIRVATELLPEPPQVVLMDCDAGEARQDLELHFERITADPDRDEMRRLLSRGAQRTVVFDWDPDTGELSYGPSPVLTPPVARGAAASSRSQARCVLR